MSRKALPRLSQQALEDIVVAVTRATDERGLRVQLRLEDVLLPELLEQMPKPIFGCNR